MIVLRKIKENLFLSIVLFAYIVLLIIQPSMGISSLKNSGFYIKEMLMIMPVIFLLTALLDMWVPKEKIMEFLGKEAGAKGIFLAFVVGSISAGPIYAAFPMCIMLYKKGASIRNIIIILSSWAVIKIPMLLNEAKFLGIKFMIIRWLLTVIAIIIFSWLGANIIKDRDLIFEKKSEKGLHLNRESCMGCNLCVEIYPAIFEIEGRKAIIKTYEESSLDKEKLQGAIDGCPVNAIEYL